MPKKIKVLARTLPYGDKLLGKNGEYTVNDFFAKNCLIDGTAEIVEDLGTDEAPAQSGKRVDAEFMAKIRHHAPEILEILDQQYRKTQDEERARQHSEAASEPKTISSELSDGKTEETGTSTEKLSPSDELGGIVTATDNSNNVQSTPIPEDFPGSQVLIKHGITTLEAVQALGYDELIEKGVPQGTANQIGAKLVEMSK